jgi:hypothetical protein
MGYAGNLLRIEHMEDGPRQILDSIGGEFGSVIHDDGGSRGMADRHAFASWAEHRSGQGGMAIAADEIRSWLNAAGGGQVGEAKSRLIAELKSKGLLDEKAGEGALRKKLTRLFFDEFDESEAEEADAAFAMLLSLRYLYGDAERTLHLGTVVQDEKDSEFWLCVQPVCDSVRLGDQAGFPLLRLRTGKPGKKAPVRFPVEAGGKTEMLSSSAKADEIEVIQFAPDPALKRVVFEKSPSDGRHRIQSVDNGTFVWLAELKTAHSNRVAHQLGEQLARVGLDESVWLSELS